MILFKCDQTASVYTIDPDTDELYCAPIYSDESVDLNDFGPVDYYRISEEDQKHCDQIINTLKSYTSKTVKYQTTCY